MTRRVDRVHEQRIRELDAPAIGAEAPRQATIDELRSALGLPDGLELSYDHRPGPTIELVTPEENATGRRPDAPRYLEDPAPVVVTVVVNPDPKSAGRA